MPRRTTRRATEGSELARHLPRCLPPCLTACLLACLILASHVQTVASETAGTAVSEAVPRERLSSGDITVLHRADDVRPATRMLDVAASKASSVARAAGLVELGPVTIFVASSDAEFRALTYGGVPDWGAGCAFPTRGIIVLRNPITAPDPLHMEDVVVHEMAHVAAGRVLGETRVPRWFHEGIAMTLAGEWRLPRSASLAGASASGSLIPLEELRSTFPAGGNEAMLAYTESFHALRHLEKAAGGATPAELLAGVATAGAFEPAIEALTGSDLETFEREAVSSFRKRFGWGVLLSRWDVRFALLALVLLVGGAARLRRSRRQLKQWEAEERARWGDSI